MSLIISLINYYSLFIFIYFFALSIFYVVLIILSYKRLKKYLDITSNDITMISDYTKPISILVPAFNEAETIIDNIKSLLDINYPNFEIIIINDGSQDETLKKVIDHFKLRKIDIDLNIQIPCNEIKGVYSSFKLSKLVIVDKVNSGKSDSLNVGINVSRYPLFVAIDADCIVEKDSLLKVVKPFLKYENTIAVGGIIRVANGSTIDHGTLISSALPKKLIEKFQVIEYFRSFVVSRVGFENLNALMIISGAFGLFKKSAVINVGGYKKTVGEDLELTLRLHEYHRQNKIPYKVDYTSDAVCWTQVPSSLKDLRTQRVRWHRGLIDSISKHKKMLFNPKYGVAGLVSMPYLFLIEMLGPIFEIIGYLIMIISLFCGVLSKNIFIIFLMAYLFGALLSISAITLERYSYMEFKGIKNLIKLILYSLLEQFIYRQLTVLWRVFAFFNLKKGKKLWGAIKRNPFSQRG